MKNNIKIAKELIKLAKSLISSMKIEKTKYFAFDAKGKSIELLILGQVNNISKYTTKDIDNGTNQFIKQSTTEIVSVNGNAHKWHNDNTKQQDNNIYYFIEGDIPDVDCENYEDIKKQLQKKDWQDASPTYLMNLVKKF